MGVTHFSGLVKPVIDWSANSGAKTLRQDQSGSTVLLGGTGAAITFPDASLEDGMYFEFFVAAVFSTDFVFTASPTDSFEGCILEVGAVQDVDAADTITLEDGVENLGDWYYFVSGNSKWFVMGSSLTAASVTPAG